MGELNDLRWRIKVLDRKVQLLIEHFALDEGLTRWQRLALSSSSKEVHVIKACIDETGASLAEAKAAVEKWLGGD
jgi:ribosomal protein L7/L12